MSQAIHKIRGMTVPGGNSTHLGRTISRRPRACSLSSDGAKPWGSRKRYVRRRADSAKPRPSDAKLRAQTDMIPALPVTERLRQLEAEAAFFSSLRPLDD